MTMLAPVGISVYTRINHFKRSVRALQQNSLASDTNLIIYSDAASRVEDEGLVHEVRQFAHSIQGFKTVVVIERPTNYGGVKNAHEGLKQLVRVFKIAIWLEDDIEVASGFLSFMNEALNFYKDNPSVTSISGYSPPLAISDYVIKDFYTMNRFCGWGCGVYERTMDWLAAKITQDEYDRVADKQILCEFGSDVLNMVEREVANELDAADVRCMFRQAVNGTATIYPKYSLVQNTGHDGTGFHCGKSKRFTHDKLWNKNDGFCFDNDTSCIAEIKKEKQDFRAFKGLYKHLQTIFNLQQSRDVASSLLKSHFDNTLKTLLKTKSQNKVVREKFIALISTPRVGSTWLCETLSVNFGQCIANEWLHRRFVDNFLQINEGSSALDFLTLLKERAFPDTKIVVLHFHVNQYRYWLNEHGVDLFDFFSFSHVFYMKRKNLFSQIFSYALASETGMWGDSLIQRANFSDKFSVCIERSAFEKAEASLHNELQYFAQKLEEKVDSQFEYESFLGDFSGTASSIFSVVTDEPNISICDKDCQPKIVKSFVDINAKTKLEKWFKARTAQDKNIPFA